MSLGAILRAARIQRQLALRQIAAQISVPAYYLSDVEHDRTQPTLSVLKMLAKRYGITVEDLFPHLSIGQRLAYLRHRCGWGLAKMAYLTSSSAMQIHRLELGYISPSAEELNQFAALFGVDINSLSQEPVCTT